METRTDYSNSIMLSEEVLSDENLDSNVRWDALEINARSALILKDSSRAFSKFKELENENGEKTLIEGGKVVFFSLEMSSEQLATRILAEQSKISGDKMRKAELSKEDFKNIANISSKLIAKRTSPSNRFL